MTADIISLASEGWGPTMLAVSIVVLLTLLSVADHLIERRPFFGRALWALVDSAMPIGLSGRLTSWLDA